MGGILNRGNFYDLCDTKLLICEKVNFWIKVYFHFYFFKRTCRNYYRPEGKQRGEWLFTVEAMGILYPKK
ncbi:hypothetical protein BW892_25845 [Bacillus cereus]|uniref:Uncharacterized protein n=1 Tax=Bacillus cereus TaxID=1396 RepID=A0A1S9UA74_BACCE|nr:hypothetical protein BW892_25845 [Bacillus cereus]